MSSLKGTETEHNRMAAFAGERQASRRYLYFAQKADLGAAIASETREYTEIYPGMARVARQEGFDETLAKGREVACRALRNGARRKLEHDRRKT